jgi:lysophospholipase L1-like esterase
MKKAIWALILTHSLLAAPVTALLVGNSHFRFQFLEKLSYYHGKIFHTEYVFVGDSITAGGGSWGWRLDRNPFRARNLGSNGLVIHQVADIAKACVRTGKPAWVCVMAGANDVSSPGYDEAASARAFSDMVRTIRSYGTRVLVTLPTYGTDPARNALIGALSARIEAEAGRAGANAVIDLNAELAPDGMLLDRYRTDSVHLSEAAYGVWTDRIREAVVASR